MRSTWLNYKNRLNIKQVKFTSSLSFSDSQNGTSLQSHFILTSRHSAIVFTITAELYLQICATYWRLTSTPKLTKSNLPPRLLPSLLAAFVRRVSYV